MSDLNKVMIIGRLGADPETRYIQSGKAVTNIRVATSEKWKKDGEQHERTDWHSVTMWDKLGEIAAEYLRKGSQVYIEGKLQTRKWKDKEGNDRYTTEIVANQMQMLGSKPSTERREAPARSEEPRQQTTAATDQGGFDDDIPF